MGSPSKRCGGCPHLSELWGSRRGLAQLQRSLLAHFQDDLRLARQWWVDGRHYEKTSNHWLAGMDAARHEIMALFRTCYGKDQAAIWFQRWRMFYMAVAELFGYDHGREWGVGHYLFSKR